MPVPITENDTSISPQRIKKLETEVSRLRREIDKLRGQVNGDGGRGAMAGWITTILAAFGALVGMFSLFHH